MSSFESIGGGSPSLGGLGVQHPRRPGPSVVSGQGRRVSGGGDPLLPPFSISTTVKSAPQSITSPNTLSRTHSYSPNPNAIVRSPTLAPPSHPYLSASAASSARQTPKPSRPPSVASNPVNTAYRHRRSNSLSSTASGNSRADEVVAHSRPGSIAGGAGRQSQSPTFAVDSEWPTQEQTAQIRRQKEEEDEKRENDEREKEAKVQRKIADLEISNSSLLTVNASLERLKLKHVKEIRDLRRKLRESGNLGPLTSAAPREGVPRPQRMGSFAGDENEEGSYDEEEEDEDEDEPTWEEMLEADEAFALIARRLEALTKRAGDAVKWEPEKPRVLTQVEVEERWNAEGDEDSEGEGESGTGLGISQREEDSDSD